MITTLVILASLASLALHVLGAWILIKHRRNVAHHRATMPVIGSNLKLTEALHARLKANAPQSDWMSPPVMRGKINAWLRRNREQGGADS